MKNSSLSQNHQINNSSLGDAHAEVTNALFLHLGKPPFLMCPVEYSGNRANPSVTKSEYLATLGSKLLPDIGIFWTGGKGSFTRTHLTSGIFLDFWTLSYPLSRTK